MSDPAVPPDTPLPPPAGLEGRATGSPAARTAVLVVFLLIYFALRFGACFHRSATFDEPIHLTAGYAALTQRDYRVDPTHPPLLRMWAALPLLAFETTRLDSGRIDMLPQPAWIPEAYRYAHDFLYAGPHADRNLNVARGMIIFLGALTGVLLYCWALEWLGFLPAVLALVFYLIEPNLGAHATLVTTDCGITCFFFGTIYFFWRTWRNYSGWNLAGLALFFSLACVSKYNAVLLVPVGGLLLAATTRRGGNITPWRAAGITALLAGSAVIAIWTVYGFRYAPSATPGWLFAFKDSRAGAEPLLTWGSAPLAWIDRHQLLPNAYTQGFLLSVSQAQPMPAYLDGAISTTGWWYFYPAAFLLKTPVSLIVLLIAGLAVLAARRRVLGPLNALVLLLPVAVYVAGAMASDIQLGVRHLLPIYPFVILIAGISGWGIARRRPGWRMQLAALALLLGVWLVSYSRVYPYGLTFFNELAGSPQRAARFLTDSNLDWGQSLKMLKQWMDENGVSRINLAYFGSADPDYYDIDSIPLPGMLLFNQGHARAELPGVVAVSSTTLSGVYLEPSLRLFYSGFKALKPVAVVGNTINVYRIDQWPEAVDADLVPLDAHRKLASYVRKLNWPDLAVRYFKHYLAQRPDDGRAHLELGWALLQLNRKDEALRAFRRAVELDPQNDESRTSLIGELFWQNRTADGIAAAREWIRLRPESATAHDLLGVGLTTAGQLEAARKSFARAHSLAPHNVAIRRHFEQSGKTPGGAR
ncbi:MAG TPA: tetratricopeptide repeat protein [Lacunisphaera sp.]|nr:tetratricopeptide repeat protein [Lacunisphaera sp.]